MATTANSHGLNKDRAIGAEAALISIQKRVYRLLREAEISNKTRDQIVLIDVLDEIVDMRSKLASLYVGNNRRVKHGRN